MESKRPLTDLYKLYSMGELSKKDFEGRMFMSLLDDSERYHLTRGNLERWEEFLSWLYPRISRSIDRYRDLGSSFDAYIYGMIRSAYREYQGRETNHSLTEYACWRARAEEMTLHENEPDYPELRKNVSIPADLKPRQVLFLLLKSYYFVTDEYVDSVAGVVGLDADKVKKMISELRRRRSGREIEILNLRERLHCQYYRCLAYQKRMKSAFQGTEYFERMKDRFERAMIRYQCMRTRFYKMRRSASNRMIAEVMGIPKGTVDSGLYAIKDYIVSGIL